MRPKPIFPLHHPIWSFIDYRTHTERRRGPGAGLSQGLLHDTPDTWYLCNNSLLSFKSTDLKGLSKAIKAERKRRGEGRGRREVSLPVSATNPGAHLQSQDIHRLYESLRLINLIFLSVLTDKPLLSYLRVLCKMRERNARGTERIKRDTWGEGAKKRVRETREETNFCGCFLRARQRSRRKLLRAKGTGRRSWAPPEGKDREKRGNSAEREGKDKWAVPTISTAAPAAQGATREHSNRRRAHAQPWGKRCRSPEHGRG